MSCPARSGIGKSVGRSHRVDGEKNQSDEAFKGAHACYVVGSSMDSELYL